MMVADDIFPPFLVVVLLGVVSVFLLPRVLFRKQEPKNIPKGSMGWPLIGETLSFLKPHKSNTPGSYLQDHCSRYGRVFKSHLFGSPTIVSCDHELNMFILENEERLFQGSYPKLVDEVLGKLSLFVVVGDLHKRLRNFALNLGNMLKSKPEYIYDVDQLSISIMESWKNKREVIFFAEMKKFTFNVIVKQILSMDHEGPEVKQIFEAFLTLMKGMVSLPLNVPGTSYAKAVKARKKIHSILRVIIRERTEGERNGKGDYLDFILSNSSLSDEEIVSILLDLLLGGYVTTSTLLAMAVYFLEKSPHALAKLKEEHQAIRNGKGVQEALTWEDYRKMEFTQNVISETLRCGNVIKLVHRKALKDVNFKGYLIPSGWKVLPILTAVHLDSTVHQDPSEFNPWRSLDSQGKGKNFAPFGGGTRLCPGSNISKIETAIFLHHFVLNFRWKAKGEDHPVAYPSMEFHKGLPIEIEPLENKLSKS